MTGRRSGGPWAASVESMDRRRLGNIAGIALAIVLLVGFGLGRVIGGVPDPPASDCDDPIPWHAADGVEGEQAAVAGPVAAVSHEPEVGGSPTFVNLGAPHPDPDRFDIVIYEEVREGFDRPLEELLPGEDVCVQGRVRDRDGVAQIVIELPASLIIR